MRSVSVSQGSPGLFRHWWRTIDRLNVTLVFLLAGVGALVVLAASPPVAERLGYPEFYFIERHLVVLTVTLALMLVLSLLSPTGILRISIVGLALASVLLVMVVFWGFEAKGAKRWLIVGGLSLQPSEIVKPFFAVMTGWLFAAGRKVSTGWLDPAPRMYLLFSALMLATLWSLIFIQPDFSMAMIIAVAWCGQFFIAGLRLRMVPLAAALGGAGMWAAYILLPHVKARVDGFLDSAAGPGFQVGAGLEAYGRGGLLGQGAGGGVIKERIPDSHTDFVFPVIAEEFGFIACFGLLSVIALIAFRGIVRLADNGELFPLIAAGGLLIQFALQALVNVSVTLDLVPTTGMTLPFVSVGGSSLFAVGIAMGCVLALTRRRVTLSGNLW